jgi:hypothetical protein
MRFFTATRASWPHRRILDRNRGYFTATLSSVTASAMPLPQPRLLCRDLNPGCGIASFLAATSFSSPQLQSLHRVASLFAAT